MSNLPDSKELQKQVHDWFAKNDASLSRDVEYVMSLISTQREQARQELLRHIEKELPKKWYNQGDMKDPGHAYDVGYDQAIDDLRDVLVEVSTAPKEENKT